MSNKKWTKEEQQNLIKLLKSNMSWIDIVKAMNRTEVAVERKAMRLGMYPLVSIKKSRKRLVNLKDAGKIKIDSKEADKIPYDLAVRTIIEQLDYINIEKMPIITAPVLNQGAGDEEQAVLHLTDIHNGRLTVSFNSHIAKERMVMLVESLLKIVALHRLSHPVRIINVFLTGDNICSENIGYQVDLSELEMILRDQIYGNNGIVPLLAWLFQVLLQNFEQVNVYCVRGNHGRGPKGSSEKTNWDDVVYYTLREKFLNNNRIHFEIADIFYLVANICGWRFLLTHGDQVRGGSYGIPLYALLQRMLRWATALPQKWDYLVVGHWHTLAEIEQNKQELFVGGTFVSDDDYVLRQYGWNSSTKQWFFLVHPNWGVTVRRPISLEEFLRKEVI